MTVPEYLRIAADTEEDDGQVTIAHAFRDIARRWEKMEASLDTAYELLDLHGGALSQEDKGLVLGIALILQQARAPLGEKP